MRDERRRHVILVGAVQSATTVGSLSGRAACCVSGGTVYALAHAGHPCRMRENADLQNAVVCFHICAAHNAHEICNDDGLSTSTQQRRVGQHRDTMCNVRMRIRRTRLPANCRVRHNRWHTNINTLCMCVRAFLIQHTQIMHYAFITLAKVTGQTRRAQCMQCDSKLETKCQRVDLYKSEIII